MIDKAVDDRFAEAKKDSDKRFEAIDAKFKDQEKDSSEIKSLLYQLIDKQESVLAQRKSRSPEKRSDEPGTSRKSRRSRRSRDTSESRNRSGSSKKQSKRSRSQSPSKTNKKQRTKKQKDDRIPRKVSAEENLREQQNFRDDFTTEVTSIPKWLVLAGDDCEVNPVAYIAARFGYIHEECRAFARSKDDRGQTYETWRNYFHQESRSQVRNYDEKAGKAYYQMVKLGKKPRVEHIVPWFKRQKNRSVAQIHPETDSKNLLVWHTHLGFLDNFFKDIGGKSSSFKHQKVTVQQTLVSLYNIDTYIRLINRKWFVKFQISIGYYTLGSFSCSKGILRIMEDFIHSRKSSLGVKPQSNNKGTI